MRDTGKGRDGVMKGVKGERMRGAVTEGREGRRERVGERKRRKAG